MPILLVVLSMFFMAHAQAPASSTAPAAGADSTVEPMPARAVKEKERGAEPVQKTTEHVESHAVEQSMREYESRFNAMIKHKRDSLSELEQAKKINSQELEKGRRELDSLEMVFKRKKLEILTSSSLKRQQEAQQPRQTGPGRPLTAREAQAARIQGDTGRQVIVVGRQPGQGKEVLDSVITARSFRQWMVRNFMSSLGTIEKIGSLEIGMNFYAVGDPIFPMEGQKRYHVGNAGLRAGLMFPLRTPFLLSYYKVRVLFHKAQLTATDTSGYTYLTGTNEIMLGKNFFIRNQPFEYIPNISVGYNNGIIVEKVFHAGIAGREVHYFWFWSLGVIAKRHFEVRNQRFALGLSFNFERAFVCNEDTKMRLSINGIGSY